MRDDARGDIDRDLLHARQGANCFSNLGLQRLVPASSGIAQRQFDRDLAAINADTAHETRVGQGHIGMRILHASQRRTDALLVNHWSQSS